MKAYNTDRKIIVTFGPDLINYFFFFFQNGAVNSFQSDLILVDEKGIKLETSVSFLCS